MSEFDKGLPNGAKINPGTPLSVTEINSGSGTYVPSAKCKWLKVMLLGGGAGGDASAAGGNWQGGKAAIPVTYWIRRDSSFAYAIGAGGTGTLSGAGSSGGDTTFGSYTGFGAIGASGLAAIAGLRIVGENSPYGKGGAATGGAASGFGAGGGGHTGAAGTGGAGSGGKIIVEEY